MPNQGGEKVDRKQIELDYFMQDLKHGDVAELDQMIEQYGYDEEFLKSPEVMETARTGLENAKKEGREHAVSYLKGKFDL